MRKQAILGTGGRCNDAKEVPMADTPPGMIPGSVGSHGALLVS
jgi:hypothetical protein